MNIKKSMSTAILTSAVALFTSLPGQAQQGQGPDGMQNAPMNPQMMHRMMKQRQQMMQDGEGEDYGMGDMNMHRRHHMMMQKMMERRMQGRGNGQRGGMGMMKPRMMQQKMQHMQEMEARLSKIESLLQELVELQKKQ